jgi:hypothetical protein
MDIVATDHPDSNVSFLEISNCISDSFPQVVIQPESSQEDEILLNHESVLLHSEPSILVFQEVPVISIYVSVSIHD